MKPYMIGLMMGLLAAGGCSEPGASHTPARESQPTTQRTPDVLRIAVTAEPGSLNIQKAILGSELRILYQLYFHLLELDADGNIIPGVAHSWSFSNDQRTLTFELRDDLTWSDGRPVDAHDFLFALRQSNECLQPVSKRTMNAAGFDEDNPLTVRLRFFDAGVAMKQALVAIMGMWKQVGVNAQLHQAETKVHYADLENKNYQVALGSCCIRPRRSC